MLVARQPVLHPRRVVQLRVAPVQVGRRASTAAASPSTAARRRRLGALEATYSRTPVPSIPDSVCRAFEEHVSRHSAATLDRQQIQTPAADASALERVMFEVKRVIVGQERLVERMIVSLLAQGHCLLEGVPGVAKTLAVETLARTVSGSFARLQFTPDLVPSDIVGTRIYRPGAETLRHRTRPDHGQLRARRRDQPRAGQGAVGAARGDGRAARHDRRCPARRARAVPRARHPEPDRVRGRLPAARGAARPVPDEDRRRVPERRRGTRDRLSDGRRAAVGQRRARAPTTCSACRQPRAGCSCTTRSSTTSCVSCSLPAARSSTGCPTSPSGSPTAPARGPASDSSRPAGPWPCCADATTSCRRTSWTSPSTFSRTGSCSATTRSPTASRPSMRCAGCCRPCPLPQVAPRQRAGGPDMMAPGQGVRGGQPGTFGPPAAAARSSSAGPVRPME